MEDEHRCDLPSTATTPGEDWECEVCGRRWWNEDVDASGLTDARFVTRWVPYESG